MGGSITNKSSAYGDRNCKPETKIAMIHLILPRKITDNKLLELIALLLGPILDQLCVKIIDTFHFSLASPSVSTTVEGPSTKSNHAAKLKKNSISSNNSTLTKR